MSRDIVPELQHERVTIESRLDDPALDSSPASVNETHLGQPTPSGR